MFFQKNEPPDFLFFFVKNVFFGLKKHVFLFLRNKKPISNCFYCIMQYRHFQNCTIIICYAYDGIQV